MKIALLFTLITSFQTPEGTLYYPEGPYILISNIQGSPTAKDGKGYISALNLDGKLIHPYFIRKNLDAPKGMALQDGILYVADIDRVQAFQLSKKGGSFLPGKSFSLKKKGAKFLNDCALLNKETLLVTDTQKDIIWAIHLSTRDIAVWRSLPSPNGIWVSPKDQRVYVVSWGEGKFFALDYQGKLLKSLTIAPSLDGITLCEHDLWISSWDGHLYKIDKSFKNVTKYPKVFVSPADITCFKKQKKPYLVVPEFEKDRVQLFSP